MVGLLSLVYLIGIWSLFKVGIMIIRYGRGLVMLFSTGVMLFGLLMILFSSLWLIFVGMLFFLVGFFVVYLVVSSWIGFRVKRVKG